MTGRDPSAAQARWDRLKVIARWLGITHDAVLCWDEPHRHEGADALGDRYGVVGDPSTCCTLPDKSAASTHSPPGERAPIGPVAAHAVNPGRLDQHA